jgi:hypothetical protein
MVSEQTQNIIHEQLRHARIELNTYRPQLFANPDYPPQPKTAGEWFSLKFPDQAKIYGAPFLEVRENLANGFQTVTPISLNIDFFAAVIGGSAELGHKVVYHEPEMQFYYYEPRLKLFKPTTPEKLQNLIRALLVRCAQELPNDVHKLSLYHQFRSDKMTKQIVYRAKSILAADHTFFSADSKYDRDQGPETAERLIRVFAEQVFERSPGQILPFNHAYLLFIDYLKQKNVPEVKRPVFKDLVCPLVREQFDLGLRNDLITEGTPKQQQGWKGLKTVGFTSVIV